MTIIVTATNGWVAGVRVPSGTMQLPVSGVIGVSSEGYASNTITVGGGDTLVLSASGPQVLAGYGAAEAWAIGFCLGLLGFGTIGTVRRLARLLPGVRASDL